MDARVRAAQEAKAEGLGRGKSARSALSLTLSRKRERGQKPYLTGIRRMADKCCAGGCSAVTGLI